jgi:hypothetical protein
MVVILDTYPRKYWWPVLQGCSRRTYKVACRGDSGALLMPSKNGWKSYLNIPGDLFVFSVAFSD